MYKPLPDCLTIKNSKIEGLGLFAVKDIPKGQGLGISHVYNTEFEDGWIRTPLGGFVNHSDDPNAVKMKDLITNYYHLIALRDINTDEEVTVKYTFYDVHAPPK